MFIHTASIIQIAIHILMQIWHKRKQHDHAYFAGLIVLRALRFFMPTDGSQASATAAITSLCKLWRRLHSIEDARCDAYTEGLLCSAALEYLSGHSTFDTPDVDAAIVILASVCGANGTSWYVAPNVAPALRLVGVRAAPLQHR